MGNACVVKIPKLGALRSRLPLTKAVAMRKHPLFRARFLFIASRATDPVSYTNLDVYKRQTKSFGAAAPWRAGNDAKRLMLVLILGSLAGAGLAFALIHGLKPNIDSLNRVIRSALAVALFGTAIALMLRPWLLRMRRPLTLPIAANDIDSQKVWPTMALGLAIGAVVTLSSIGAGAIGVTALLLLHPALPISRVVGTDIAYACLLYTSRCV